MVFVANSKLNGCSLVAKLEVRRDFCTQVAWHVVVDFEGDANLLQSFGTIQLGDEIFFSQKLSSGDIY